MTENSSTNKFNVIQEFKKKLDKLSIQHPKEEIVRIMDIWYCKLQLGPFLGKAEAKRMKVSKRLAYQRLDEQMQKGGVFDAKENIHNLPFAVKKPGGTEHRNSPDYQRQENSQMHTVPPAYPSTAQLQPISANSTAVQYYRGLVIAKLNFRSILKQWKSIKLFY